MAYYKGKFGKVSATAVELVFWFVVISVAIFINLSPKVFSDTKPILLVVLYMAFLAFILKRGLPQIVSSRKKTLFIITVIICTLFPFLLIGAGAGRIAIFYYMPLAFSIAMACLIIMVPRVYIITVVGISLFILSEVFQGIYMDSGMRLRFPIETMRTFSMTVTAIFAYYLYKKEMGMRSELKALNEKLKLFDAMKSNFIANISHELRTPLTSIKNAAVLLNRKTEKSVQPIAISDKELLDIILSNVDRQARLVNGLLDLAKIESGKLKVARCLVDIGKIAAEVANSLKMQADVKDVKMTAEIEPDLPMVYASADQIAEVYTNLLDNAIKYTRDNGRVILRISSSSAGVKSAVEDNGAGIAPEDIGKLFDKFKRLEDMVEHKSEGTGLGLVIAKEIVESHGGKIWVESKPGSGSKFIFTLSHGLRNGD